VTILGSKNLNHHGIVAAMCRELQVAEIIDALIPAGNRKKLSFGQLTEGMLIKDPLKNDFLLISA
jgi:hypothetical protein